MDERDRLPARLAFNRRSRWITSPASYSPWEKGPMSNFTFDASNILGSPYRNFRQFTPEGDTSPRDVRYEAGRCA